MYSRSFGFNHSDGMTYDALYAHHLELDHLLNAIDLVFMMDHVLPFKRSLNHSVWSRMFDALSLFGFDGDDAPKYWLHANAGNMHHDINSKRIEAALSEEDKKWIKNKNMFDLWLYRVANMIADADSLFLDFLN